MRSSIFDLTSIFDHAVHRMPLSAPGKSEFALHHALHHTRMHGFVLFLLLGMGNTQPMRQISPTSLPSFYSNPSRMLVHQYPTPLFESGQGRVEGMQSHTLYCSDCDCLIQ